MGAAARGVGASTRAREGPDGRRGARREARHPCREARNPRVSTRGGVDRVR